MRFLLAGFTIAFAIGCVALPSHQIMYSIGLDEVERPTDTSNRWGPVQVAQGDSAGVTRYTFTHSLVSVMVIPTQTAFALQVENRSAHSLRIIWDQAVYVGASGNVEKLLPSTTTALTRNKSIPPSVIPRAGKLTEIFMPADHAHFRSGWYFSPLVKNYKVLATDTLAALDSASRHVGERLRLVLPIEVQGVINEYTLIFKVGDPRVERYEYGGRVLE